MGPRRAGKSVAVKRAIARLIRSGVKTEQMTFVPCDDLTGQDLRRMVKIATDLTSGLEDSGRYWFFDEITYVRNWVETLKQLRDQAALRTGCVVATGSSAAKLREAQGGLGGREGPAGGVRLLLPMGFRDFLRGLYPDLAASLPPDVVALGDLQTYLSEQQVGVALLRVIARSELAAIMDEAAVLVRRNPDSGSEIDFVGDLVETPIESKYVSQKWKQERAALEEHYKRGIVATRDILDLDDDIWAVPAGLLAWSING